MAAHEMESPDSPTRQKRWRQLAGISLAHLVADGYASFATPLLSTLALTFGVEYRSVSLLIGLGAVSAAVANVVVGLASDRWKHLRRATIIVSAAVCAICMSAIGVAGSYWVLAAVMVAGMLGCGAFHPPGFSVAGEILHPHRQRGVSIAMAAGIAACGLGPIFVSQVVGNFGLRATVWCVIPGLAIVAAAGLLLRNRSPEGVANDDPLPSDATAPAAKRKVWFSLLFANTVLRELPRVGVAVIVSFLVEKEWGLSVATSGLGIGALFVGAGLGGILGAYATRTGHERRTLLWCSPFSVLILIPMALTVGTAWFLWLFFFGLTVAAPAPVVVGMAQRIAPHRSALVSGFLIGPAGAIAAILASATTPLLVEERGQAVTMAFLAIPLILSWLIAWFLPRADKTRAGGE